MKPANSDTDTTFQVRPYREQDEPSVLDLLKSAYGDWPATTEMFRQGPAEFFRWKHLASPFGRSLMHVAEADDQIIGFWALMRWRLVAGERLLHAVRGADSATHRHYQRKGVWTRLQREADKAVREETDRFFCTTAARNAPRHLKVGRRIAGQFPISARVRRPIRCALAWRSKKTSAGPSRPAPVVDAATAAEALADPEAVSLLLAESGVPDSCLATHRDVDYLRWRYAQLLDYRAIREEQGGRLVGLAIFRVCPRGVLWESRVTELIIRAGDRRTARRLLRRVATAAPVDLLACHFQAGSSQARAAAQTGFLRSPGRVALVVSPSRHNDVPDPTDIGSWALSLGDLELF